MVTKKFYDIPDLIAVGIKALAGGIFILIGSGVIGISFFISQYSWILGIVGGITGLLAYVFGAFNLIVSYAILSKETSKSLIGQIALYGQTIMLGFDMWSTNFVGAAIELYTIGRLSGKLR